MGLSIDREKVIKGLHYCFTTANCDGCPYEVECRKISFKTPENHCPILDDVLALLKEQNAIEPTFKQDNDGIFVWACGSCGAYMYHIYNGIDKAKEYAKYCRQCGRKVKWE